MGRKLAKSVSEAKRIAENAAAERSMARTLASREYALSMALQQAEQSRDSAFRGRTGRRKRSWIINTERRASEADKRGAAVSALDKLAAERPLRPPGR
jgi:hypothetical protein